MGHDHLECRARTRTKALGFSLISGKGRGSRMEVTGASCITGRQAFPSGKSPNHACAVVESDEAEVQRNQQAEPQQEGTQASHSWKMLTVNSFLRHRASPAVGGAGAGQSGEARNA